MTLGISLFAIVVGALLRLLLNATLAEIDTGTVGVALTVIGTAGLAVGRWPSVTGHASTDLSV